MSVEISGLRVGLWGHWMQSPGAALAPQVPELGQKWTTHRFWKSLRISDLIHLKAELEPCALGVPVLRGWVKMFEMVLGGHDLLPVNNDRQLCVCSRMPKETVPQLPTHLRFHSTVGLPTHLRIPSSSPALNSEIKQRFFKQEHLY